MIIQIILQFLWDVLSHLYTQLLIITTLGQATHLLLKARSLQYKAKIANTTFSGKEFLKNDSINIAITFVFMASCLFFLEEVTKVYPIMSNWTKGVFWVIGYAGSDLAFRVGGKTSKLLNRVIDEKTNELDKLKGE